MTPLIPLSACTGATHGSQRRVKHASPPPPAATFNDHLMTITTGLNGPSLIAASLIAHTHNRERHIIDPYQMCPWAAGIISVSDCHNGYIRNNK